MGLLNTLLGFRWSLYVVRNENQLVYAMNAHDNASKLGVRGDNNTYAAAIVFVIAGTFAAHASAAWNMWLSDDSYEECLIKAIQEHGIRNDAVAREIVKKCRPYPVRGAPYDSSGIFGSRTAGNCVLKNGGDVQGPLGTRLLTMACYRTYPRE